MRRIKLSLEFVGWWGRRRGTDRSGGTIFMFLRKQKSAGANLSLSLLNLLPWILRYPSVLWLTDAVTSGDMPLFRKGVGVWKGGNVGSLRHVVHMSSGNEKYCVGNVARRVSNFATFIALLQASLSLAFFRSEFRGMTCVHIIISNLNTRSDRIL